MKREAEIRFLVVAAFMSLIALLIVLILLTDRMIDSSERTNAVRETRQVIVRPTQAQLIVRPTQAQLRAARSELEIEAADGGRWLGYSVLWDEDTQKVLIGVVAYPDANSLAIDFYCDIMRDVARDHLPRIAVSAGVIRSGEITVC